MSKIKITINDQEIESLDQAIKLIQEAKEKKGLWRPEIGQSYHFIDPGNTDCFGLGKWENDKWDNNYVLVGNCFPNRIEAQAELDKRKALVRIKDYIAREGIEREEINLSNIEQLLWSIYNATNMRKIVDNCAPDLKILFGIE